MTITGLDNCKAYINAALIYSEEWIQRLKTIRECFERLSEANMTITLAKSEEAEVKAISDFFVLTCKRQPMQFLGMAGYYRTY